MYGGCEHDNGPISCEQEENARCLVKSNSNIPPKCAHAHLLERERTRYKYNTLNVLVKLELAVQVVVNL